MSTYTSKAAIALAFSLVVGVGQAPPAVVSPEVTADHRITFRIMAPQAKAVTLRANDIPEYARQGPAFTKDESGVWTATSGPIDPGAYRYKFNVDGVPTIDPRNPNVSESNTNVWSLVYVPGSDFMDTKDVPHGAVAAVTYYSDRARAASAACTSTRRRATRRAAAKYPGLLPAARRRRLRRLRGPRSAAPASSSTT